VKRKIIPTLKEQLEAAQFWREYNAREAGQQSGIARREVPDTVRKRMRELIEEGLTREQVLRRIGAAHKDLSDSLLRRRYREVIAAGVKSRQR